MSLKGIRRPQPVDPWIFFHFFPRQARAKIFNKNFETFQNMILSKIFRRVPPMTPTKFQVTIFTNVENTHTPPPKFRGLHMEVSLCPLNTIQTNKEGSKNLKILLIKRIQFYLHRMSDTNWKFWSGFVSRYKSSNTFQIFLINLFRKFEMIQKSNKRSEGLRSPERILFNVFFNYYRISFLKNCLT